MNEQVYKGLAFRVDTDQQQIKILTNDTNDIVTLGISPQLILPDNLDLEDLRAEFIEVTTVDAIITDLSIIQAS